MLIYDSSGASALELSEWNIWTALCFITFNCKHVFVFQIEFDFSTRKVKILECCQQFTESLSLLSFWFILKVWSGERRLLCPSWGGSRESLGGTSERIFGNRKHYSELRHETPSGAEGKAEELDRDGGISHNAQECGSRDQTTLWPKGASKDLRKGGMPHQK